LLRSDKDDGTDWISALTSKGLSANVITTGQLNTGEIFIMNGNDPTFRWDSHGITAYDFKTSDIPDGLAYAIDSAKGVRFDRFGVYGYAGKDGASWNPSDIDEINEASVFSLTWNGLKVTSEDGVVATIGKTQIQTEDNGITTFSPEGHIINITKTVEENGEVKTRAIFAISNDGNLNMTGVITDLTGGQIGPWSINEDGLIGISDGKHSGFLFPKTVNGKAYPVLFAGASDVSGTGAPFLVDAKGNVTMNSASVGSEVTIGGTAVKDVLTTL
jgi:hypothetical protein